MDDELLPAASAAFGDVFVLAGHLTRLTDDGLADWSLTTRQWLLLAVLTKGFPGRAPSLTEAAAAYGTSRQNVKQIALSLQAHGWLRLAPDPLDGRAVRLELTDRVLVFDEPEGRESGRALIEAAFDGLTSDEVLDLRRLLGRWLAGVAPASPTQKRPGKVLPA